LKKGQNGSVFLSKGKYSYESFIDMISSIEPLFRGILERKQMKKRKNQGTKLDLLEIQPFPIRREWPSKVSLSVKNNYSSWWFQPL